MGEKMARYWFGRFQRRIKRRPVRPRERTYGEGRAVAKRPQGRSLGESRSTAARPRAGTARQYAHAPQVRRRRRLSWTR